ncbi:hypothetical protein [Klebsiella aerogenes]|uniref:hypothetical protein n=1 Tax=Klebsiella aerogenes TaxID=548 RepID=UPI001D0DA4E1|nr:hypothetical protein [Klebsiella aerogenes]
MKELEYIKPYSLKELITKIVHQGYTKDNFCLYTKEYEAVATPELVCYLDRYPEVSDDEDVYPEYVEQNELELFFYGDQFMDVLKNALNQIHILNQLIALCWIFPHRVLSILH